MVAYVPGGAKLNRRKREEGGHRVVADPGNAANDTLIGLEGVGREWFVLLANFSKNLFVCFRRRSGSSSGSSGGFCGFCCGFCHPVLVAKPEEGERNADGEWPGLNWNEKCWFCGEGGHW